MSQIKQELVKTIVLSFSSNDLETVTLDIAFYAPR